MLFNYTACLANVLILLLLYNLVVIHNIKKMVAILVTIQLFLSNNSDDAHKSAPLVFNITTVGLMNEECQICKPIQILNLFFGKS